MLALRLSSVRTGSSRTVAAAVVRYPKTWRQHALSLLQELRPYPLTVCHLWLKCRGTGAVAPPAE